MKRFWTIRVRFIVFALLSLLPLLGFLWLLIDHHNEARYQDLVASQSVVSNQVSTSVAGYLSSNFKGLESLATSGALIEGADTEAMTTLLGQYRMARPDILGVFEINGDGAVVAQAGIVDGTVIDGIIGQVEGVLGTGQRALSGRIDLPLDPTTSVFVMLVPVNSPTESPTTSKTSSTENPVATPVITGSEGAVSPGSVKGVIAAIIPTDSLNQTALPTNRGRSDLLILSGQQIVTATGDTRANEVAYMDNLLSQNAPFSDEGADIFKFHSLSGTQRAAVWTPLPLDSTNWSTLVTTPIPTSEWNALWQQLLAILGVATLLYLALAYTFGELTSRSLSDLSESARLLAEGDYKTPIASRGTGELGELRDSLAQLRESTEVIMVASEQRQAERQHQNEQLRDLLRRDLRMQEDERRHIAAEIHDAVSPLITGALYQSRALQRANGTTTHEMLESSLGDVNDLLERASEELHGIIFDLRPPDLDDIGVVAAIEAFVNTIQRTGLNARLEVIDEPPPLTPEVRLGIYRIVQEALHNVLRHSGADEAVVRMEYVNELLRVTVRDNGAGFDPEGARRPTSLGLLSMRERAAAIDADFEILSRPGGGTVIIVERRDTGGIMSDALLEAILRDRSGVELENSDKLPDNMASETETGNGAAR